MPSRLSDLLRNGTLNEALVHLNHSGDVVGKATNVERADLLFRALNRFWNVFSLAGARPIASDIASFAALLTDALPPEERITLLNSAEVERLAALDPPVLNHKDLNRARWQPATAIPTALRRSASQDHRRFRSGLARYRQSAESEGAALKKLANLLYIVRSNIAHGEKTPYGPDLEKLQRDEAVCQHVVAVQELVVQLVLLRPDHKLVAYGTLALGGANHDRVAGLRGTWQQCFVRGSLSTVAGCPVFRWNPREPEVPVMLLVSEELLTAWSNLDRFEGSSYRRHLVPARGEDTHHVAYVFESAAA